MVKRMEKYKKFWEAVDIEYTEKEGKRKEKSKYYTKELLEKYGVKKYVNLVLDYEFIAFKPLLHCKDFDPETNEEGEALFFDLDFSDEVYENGRKKLIWYSEKIHKKKYGKNAKKIEVNYEELDNYIPIISGRYYSYIYQKKQIKQYSILRIQIQRMKVKEFIGNGQNQQKILMNLLKNCMQIQKTIKKCLRKKKRS